MKSKEIYEFLINLRKILQSKLDADIAKGLPQTAIEHTSGQLYETSYIIEKVEEIIFKD